MKSFNNIIHIPDTIFKLLYNVKKQKSFIHKTLEIDIKNADNFNDNSIDETDIKKITAYYGLGIPAIMGTSFGILRASSMSFRERTAITYLGAMTGLGDDFFDVNELKENELKYLLHALLNDPFNVKVNSKSENLFLRFYIKVLENTTQHKQIKHFISQLFDAQYLSLKQMSPDITYEEIKKITLQKGGVSLLLCRSVFNHPLSEEEEKMLFALGGLMQLGNDIFDVYKDNLKGIKTLANTETHIENLRRTFDNQMNETFTHALKTNYRLTSIKSFLRFISMFICRTYVCLDMFEQLQKKTNNTFTPSAYTRKDLICDMEKPANLLKSIMYYCKYNI